MTKINAQTIQDLLLALLSNEEAVYNAFEETTTDAIDPDVNVDMAMTFEDAGIMTTDKGLVLKCSDGSEYQLTIVRSR